MVSACFGPDVCWQSVSQCIDVPGCSWTSWWLSFLWRGVSMMHYSASRAAHQSITGQSLQSTSALMDAKRNNSGDFKLSMHRRKSPKRIWFIAVVSKFISIIWAVYRLWKTSTSGVCLEQYTIGVNNTDYRSQEYKIRRGIVSSGTFLWIKACVWCLINILLVCILATGRFCLHSYM